MNIKFSLLTVIIFLVLMISVVSAMDNDESNINETKVPLKMKIIQDDFAFSKKSPETLKI